MLWSLKSPSQLAWFCFACKTSWSQRDFGFSQSRCQRADSSSERSILPQQSILQKKKYKSDCNQWVSGSSGRVLQDASFVQKLSPTAPLQRHTGLWGTTTAVPMPSFRRASRHPQKMNIRGIYFQKKWKKQKRIFVVDVPLLLTYYLYFYKVDILNFSYVSFLMLFVLKYTRMQY